MTTIQEITQQAIARRFLSLDAENQLRQILSTHCHPQELRAFYQLQAAVMEGQVKQEAREYLLQQQMMECAETTPMAS